MFTDHIHDQFGKHTIGIIEEIMPDFIKEAHEQIVTEDLSKLADGCFAYTDGINRYFPIHDERHTWLSHAYFEKFASEFDERTSNEIRERIDDAYKTFELPENNIVKIAAQEDEIDSLHSLIIEMSKFINNYKSLDIAERRKRAIELLHKAYALGRHEKVNDLIKRYASNNLNKNYAEAFARRMQYFHENAPERTLLLNMQMETPKHTAENVAKALHVFDTKTGLHKLYDNEIEDPYYGLLSPDNIEENEIDFNGHKIKPSNLYGYDYDSLNEILSDEMIEKLKTNPIETLHNAEPHVKILIIRKVRNNG